MSQVDVLIVGAGPTGLSAALELARFGVRSRVIDKKPHLTQTSNAGGVHARTLELLDKNVVQELLKRGRPCPTLYIRSQSKVLATMDISLTDSLFPYVLIIPQSDTEAVLYQALQEKGISVEWNKTLSRLTQNKDSVTAYIETAQGEEIVEAKWLVGCDGYHSTVREAVKIPYVGSDYPLRFIMIDAVMETDPPMTAPTVYPNQVSILIVPFLHSTRLIAQVSHADQSIDINQMPDEKTFTKLLSQVMKEKFTIQKPLWASRFIIHEKLADHYRENRVFIAGDAAHAHSPAGGHGMNTGIQDGINLGWKLARVIQGESTEKLLDTYEIERRPIAQTIIAASRHLTQLMLTTNKFIIGLRNFLLPTISKLPFLKKQQAYEASELSLNYRKSPLSISGAHKGKIQAGDRVPNIRFNQGADLQNLLARDSHTLLNFSDEASTHIPLTPLKILSISQEETALREYFGFKNTSGYCLIRPDLYVAVIGENLAAIREYLTRLN